MLNNVRGAHKHTQYCGFTWQISRQETNHATQEVLLCVWNPGKVKTPAVLCQENITNMIQHLE